MSGRRPSSSAAIDTAARTRPSVGPVAVASGSSTGTSDVGSGRAAATSARNAASSTSSGRWPRAMRCHASSKRRCAGELGGVEAAVVEVAGLAVDVADGGVGDGDAVEAGGDVDQRGHDVDPRRRAGSMINVDRVNVDTCTYRRRPMTASSGAGEAARLLGIQKATLYAYVSRGLIERRVAVDGRTSLYAVDDVEALVGRGRRREVEPRPSLDVQIVTGVTTLDEVGRALPRPRRRRPVAHRHATSRWPSCCGPASWLPTRPGRRRRPMTWRPPWRSPTPSAPTASQP